MSAKHTPGPWFVDKVEDRNAFNIFPVGATHALLAVKGPEFDGAHSYALAAKANAILIAAAPELLEALRGLVASLSDADDEGLIEHASQMEAARAAIAKAVGRLA